MIPQNLNTKTKLVEQIHSIIDLELENWLQYTCSCSWKSITQLLIKLLQNILALQSISTKRQLCHVNDCTVLKSKCSLWQCFSSIETGQ